MTDQTTHFQDRCKTRGITSVDTKQLAEELYRAIIAGDESRAERVMKIEGSTYWRFKVPEGIFYTVTDEKTNWPKTVFTQDMIRAIKLRRKKRRRKAYNEFKGAKR